MPLNRISAAASEKTSETLKYENVFTFEVNRHGARAPYWVNDQALDGFLGNAPEQLTPMGMR